MKELSWLNDVAVKHHYLQQIISHGEADEIVKGRYWEEGKGCAVGCLIHSDDHSLFETSMGIPEWCARLIDIIFEGLPEVEAKKFPRHFVEAVPIGKNKVWWNQVNWRFGAYLMQENLERVSQLSIDERLKIEVVEAIRGALSLFTNAIASGEWGDSTARSVAESAYSAADSADSAADSADSAADSADSAADSAADSTADSTAYSAADSTAYSAADSAADSARSAAYSTATSARSSDSAADSARSAADSARSAADSASSAARSAADSAYSRYRNELIRLLKELD